MPNAQLEKIVISTGIGRLRQQAQFEEKILPELVKELALISGQHPAHKGAKKSVAGFKIREGDTVGLMITLRGKKMRDFLERLIKVVLPRVRDFRGIDPGAIDRQGNLNLGFREHTVFPEINADETKFDFGLEVTLVAKVKDAEAGYALYKSLGMPLKEKK
ncbi:MAG: 50S ribosomal protein L5 [Candidatus Colwellbacteria bacterium]|nr:50S ribosomal protein L5 [Candidatus Colwellbacteria bacterium]